MNAGFEQAIQGLQVLRNMSFFQSEISTACTTCWPALGRRPTVNLWQFSTSAKPPTPATSSGFVLGRKEMNDRV
jgi:hypothetical protein